MQTDYQDRPWDPNDPSTWTDPSGNPMGGSVNYPGQGADPAGAGLHHSVQTGVVNDPNLGAVDVPDPPPTPPDPVGRTGAPAARTGTLPHNNTPGEWDPWSEQWNPSAASPAPPSPSPSSSPGYSPPPIQVDQGTSQFNQYLRNFLMSQLGSLSGDVNADSPEVAPAISAYNTQTQRDQARNRESLTERFYALGGNGGAGLDSGGFNSAIQQGMEAASLDRANFTGHTVWNAGQSRRTQLQGMLQMAVNAGQTDAAQQIQLQIANIDANLRSQGLSQQNSQFNDQLGATYAQLEANLNRDELLAALRGQ